MSHETIIQYLDSEIQVLETAKRLLSGDTAVPKKPAGRVISIEARARISAAQKKRWRLHKKKSA